MSKRRPAKPKTAARTPSIPRREAGQTPYCGWIETYAGQEYQDVCRGVGQLIER